MRHAPEENAEFEVAVVSDPRTAFLRHPADHQLGRLIDNLRAKNDRFAELWDSGAVGRHESARKTIDHPQVGPLTLDCDSLTVAGSELCLMSTRLSRAPMTPNDSRWSSHSVPTRDRMAARGWENEQDAGSSGCSCTKFLVYPRSDGAASARQIRRVPVMGLPQAQ
ncbi:MmyB family transcriptional regulator [Streptomyces sp. NPDC002159]